ncbi:MAG TPA: PA14 domain-containing protein, partial [Aggregatilineales bacterium]|nr:PA14 domain-containing protein [Aggregatilineales bacterium]
RLSGLFAGIIILSLALSPAIHHVAAQDDQVIEECASPSWTGSFFNSSDLSGSPLHVLCRRLIDFVWGGGTPFQGVNASEFSMRWTSTQSFYTAGIWQINITLEGGARLTVNNQVIIDDMTRPQGPRTLSVNYEVQQAGAPVNMTLEFSSAGGSQSQLRMDWNLLQGGSPGAVDDHTVTMNTPPAEFNAGGGNVWQIEHFFGTQLSGEPQGLAIHVADGISYDYDDAPADAGFPQDEWSSRWTRTVDFLPGTYTFYFRGDDGGRVLVDGQVIINQPDLNSNGQTGTIELTGGRHQIVVEHWDVSGLSSIFLTWDPPVGTMLFPDGCNAVYTAGVNGSAAICPDRGIATYAP